ncbi:lysis system i-spanin subunit Rz [Pseudomonas sp. R5(2019)]|uniref:lysis system i-spanin subunit Rz n=1 Tax=Pseudomonas sp. R5(2019) TaxID=2697566 RepID=UPI001412EE51|nr:lysis system i-spanin subunit Rz [Pseudomonas sp. R5(2019)]NBA97970.1 lysis protein [Pseudomonas sp. R5(2019)]
MTISPVRLALFVLLVGLLAWVGFDLVVDQRDAARRERDTAQYELTGLREAAKVSGEMLATRDAIDQQRTQELNDAKDKNLRLQRDVDDGRQRLLVKATCPAAVPTDSGAGRVADAGTAELAADARSDYFTLRNQLALTKSMVLGLQDHILKVCQR